MDELVAWLMEAVRLVYCEECLCAIRAGLL